MDVAALGAVKERSGLLILLGCKKAGAVVSVIVGASVAAAVAALLLLLGPGA